MRLLVAALADYANVAIGDKLNLSGVFDTIWVRQFPSVHPMMVLALRLQFEYEDGGRQHTLQVIVQNQDGNQYANATAKIGIGPIPPGARVAANQVLTFQQINLIRPDQIAFIVLWDDEEKQRVMLSVEKLPDSAQPLVQPQPPNA